MLTARQVPYPHSMHDIDLRTRVSQTEERLEAERQEMDWGAAMVAEMQADLGIDPMAELCGEGDDQAIPF